MMFLPSIFGADILKCHWEGVKVFCLYSFLYLWTHFRYVSINVCYSFYYLKIIFVINKLSFETCPFPFCIKISTKVIENREDFKYWVSVEYAVLVNGNFVNEKNGKSIKIRF